MAQKGKKVLDEITDALVPRFDWHPRTVKSMLNRLVKKGALSFEQDGNRYLYRPGVPRSACVRREARSFLERVFGGSEAAMLVHFVKEGELTAADIEELKNLLAAREE